jgi:hypothetical protein
MVVPALFGELLAERGDLAACFDSRVHAATLR